LRGGGVDGTGDAVAVDLGGAGAAGAETGGTERTRAFWMSAAVPELEVAVLAGGPAGMAGLPTGVVA
jgi:hypothetical protein